MEIYKVRFLTGHVSSSHAIYHAPDLATAMAMHNEARPEYADKVLSWEGPTGLTFQYHDSKLSL